MYVCMMYVRMYAYMCIIILFTCIIKYVLYIHIIAMKQDDKDNQLAKLNVELTTTREILNDKRSSIVKLREELECARADRDQMEGRIRGLSDQLQYEGDEKMSQEKR